MAVQMQGVINYAADAGEDLSSALFTFGKVNTDGTILQANSGEAAIGVIIEAAASGSPASVQCDGIAKVILGADLNAGVKVMSDDAGKAVAAINSPAGSTCMGILMASGSSGDVVPVLLHAGGGA